MKAITMDAMLLRTSAVREVAPDRKRGDAQRRNTPGWEAPFVAIGLARVEVPLAIAELRGTLARVASGGLCTPPVHAIALRHILDRATECGGSDVAAAERFAVGSFDTWLAWHRWLADTRAPEGSGLVRIHDAGESGFDTSPRWDRPLAKGPRIRVGDVFLSAVLAAASEVLAEIGAEIGRDDATGELTDIAARFRSGVTAAVDPITGLARDCDVDAGEWIDAPTVAGFAPLVAGGDRDLLARQRTLLVGEQWMGHAALRYPLPPSTSPASSSFRRRTPWRGPVSPLVTMLLGWACTRDSAWDLRSVLRDASLEQLSDLSFAEFYEPVTGEALGGTRRAASAAVALEWLG